MKTNRIAPGHYRVHTANGVWTIRRESDPWGEWTTWVAIDPNGRESFSDTLAGAKAIVARRFV